MTELLVSTAIHTDASPAAHTDPVPAPRVDASAASRTDVLTLGLDLTGAGAGSTPWAPTAEEARVEIDTQRVADLTHLAETGVLDFVSFDDEFALAHAPVRTAASRLDAARIACRLAPVTSGVGLVATLDTSYLDPVHIATAIATLHEKSGGRAGWQVGASQARLIGDREEVWARISREIRTVVAARAARSAEAAASLGRTTTTTTAPTVVVRAGSPLAVAVAGRHADVVRVEALDAEHARNLRRDVRAAAVAAGRDPESVRVLVDVVAIVGSDAAAARARRDILSDLATSEPAWLRTLSHLGSTRQLVALLEAWVSDDVVDGFTVVPGSLPHDVRELVAEVVPALQERGLARTAYPPIR